MQNDMDTRNSLDDRRNGVSAGTITAIIAAVLVVGALLLWAPWNHNSNGGTASNSSPGTTTGSANTARPAAPATTPPASGAGTNR